MNNKHISMLALAVLAMPAMAQNDTVPGPLSPKQTVSIGANKAFNLEQTTGAVSVIGSGTLNRRDAKNIGNDIIGQGTGLESLQGAGLYSVQNPTFYIRGLQTLNNNNTPLIVVDGIERDINEISPEEVEKVLILKDAVATSLYGYKGINGVISIETKRGSSNSRSIKVSYDHVWSNFTHSPKFLNGYNYALAINEARANDGLGAMYQQNELNAFRDQTYPYLYPSVDWVGETFRNTANLNKAAIEFRGGSEKFRYYALANFLYNNGYIKNPNVNEGYSTQDKFSRGNIRMNLDIDLTPTTLVKVNVFGSLTESQRPGAATNLWNIMYQLPSAAFPIKAENGYWAGSQTWDGTLNPVAQSIGAAYYKNHERTLFADLTIRQDLGMVTPGLSAQVNVAYDNYSNLFENHSKTYQYTVVAPYWPAGQAQPTYTPDIQGADSAMGSDSGTTSFDRNLYVAGSFDYNRTFGGLGVYSQLKWDFESHDPNGINTTVRRQNISWYTHLSYADRYLFDLSLVESGSSRLAPGTKWNFSPTVGLGWIISNETFWQPQNFYLKLRATAGLLNSDFLPKDSNGNWVWTYYTQQYNLSGGVYPWTDSWTSDYGNNTLGQLATLNPSREKAYKYNVGLDFSPVEGLNVSFDYFKERRNGIWVPSTGKYSALIGLEAPFENGGVVDSHGVEVAADYSKTFGDFTLSLGGSFTFNRSKIIDQLEAPQNQPNTVTTGKPVSQLFGLVADGFFNTQEEVDWSNANCPQLFSTVRVGDIRYKDINGDGQIDANDVTAIGYNTVCPEIYYNFRVGAEYKGFGLYGFFQGVGNYTAVLNQTGMYWPLINNTNISQYAYDNRWTPENHDALFPALSYASNANNYRTSTLWMRNRSFLKLRNLEIYYNVPKAWLNSTLKVVNDARLYVRLIDFFSFDNIPENDPEAMGTARLDKSVAIGLSVTF